MPRLVLASTSPYRRELLGRLQLDFEIAAPGTDETPFPGEPPEALAERLARDKAASVATHYADALIIGSDQVASLAEAVLGKPGSHRRAAEQLANASGRRVRFDTGVCLREPSGAEHIATVPVEVDFRRLSAAAIEGYLRRERPYDCAGSFKSEGLGVVLFERIITDDPSALVGLPLIALSGMLRAAGLDPLAS